MINGSRIFEEFYRELLYGRSARDDTFQLDVERAVVSLDVAADRNVTRIVGYPKRELALLIFNQSLWSKQFRVHAQGIDAAEHRVHALSLHDLHGNGVDASTVTDIDVEALADLEWLCANEVDGRENVL